MKEAHLAIYLRAREYWNTRFNDIHVPIAYAHARDLLLGHPQADADVVIPAVLLHDVGWKSIPEAQAEKAYGPVTEDNALIRFHETEGARIATEILGAVGYEPAKTQAIARIIDGHDTRLVSLSLEDSIVKDSDKIWRFMPVGVDYHHRQFGKPLAEYLPWLAAQIDRWFFTEQAKRCARESIALAERAFRETGHV